MLKRTSGTSLIDLIISIGIIAVLFGGIYLVYFSILTAIGNINLRAAASSAIANEIETFRNLPYDSVGTAGGVPAGVIPESQTSTVGAYSFLLRTTVLNIDDPFDGTLAGNPDDLTPADYKLVSIEATCPACDSAFDETITTTVAPKGLEGATQDGTLIISVLDASGNPLALANVTIVNASVTPSINFTDTTNASGILEVIGVPTSTQGYAVTATKAGYSTDRTYPPGGAGNPNPILPNLSAGNGLVTNASFAIDRLSQLSVVTSDNLCHAVTNEPFSMKSAKIIGTNPTVFKFSTSSATNASGTAIFQNLEWDAYTMTDTNTANDLAGTIPLSPVAVNPNSSVNFRFVLQPAADPSLLVTALDAGNGAGISNATATLSKAGTTLTLLTGHATLSQSDWSSGQYTSASGVNVSAPGKITLIANASGTYSTSTIGTLVSNTFDVGGSSSTFFGISWSPTSQAVQTGPNSLELQVAANNDNATWNFVGPDGTGATYFTSPGSLPAILSGNRYFRYAVSMSTQDGGYTPELDSISFDFRADCVPPAQVLFTNLSSGNYTLDLQAQNYTENSTTITINPGFQSSTIQLSHT